MFLLLRGLVYVLLLAIELAAGLPAEPAGPVDVGILDENVPLPNCPAIDGPWQIRNCSTNAAIDSRPLCVTADPATYINRIFPIPDAIVDPNIVRGVLNLWLSDVVPEAAKPVPQKGLVLTTRMTVFELHVRQAGDRNLRYSNVVNAITALFAWYGDRLGQEKTTLAEANIFDDVDTVQGVVAITRRLTGEQCKVGVGLVPGEEEGVKPAFGVVKSY